MKGQGIRLSAFQIDCTPPVGFCVGLGTTPAVRIVDPVFLKGLLLKDGSDRYIIVSIDFCLIMGRAADTLREGFARALDIPSEQIVLHCVHQHDSVALGFETEEALGINRGYEEWWERKVAECAQAAVSADEAMTDVSDIGYSQSRIEGYASNRRVVREDGSVAPRYSRCGDEQLRDAPEGIVDPFLRTIVFKAQSGKILASLSFYATHPQVANTGDTFSADAPGEAMRLVKEQCPVGTHLFFSGAGGNVTAGKYTHPTDTEHNRRKFGMILKEAISENLKNLKTITPKGIRFIQRSFDFPVSQRISADDLKESVEDLAKPVSERIVPATVYSAISYLGENPQYTITAFDFGGARLVFLPGEPFVEYQLFLNGLWPEGFTAVAANCRNEFLYLPTSQAFKSPGGYEINSFCWCGSEFESRFKKAAAEL